jgi:hypothetical protein
MKCVFYKKKIKIKIMKRGMKEKVQFHLHLFKKQQASLYLINLERLFFRGPGTVQPIAPWATCCADLL